LIKAEHVEYRNFWQYIVKGLILIVAVWIDMAGKKTQPFNKIYPKEELK